MNTRRGLAAGVTALLCALVLPATAQASVGYRSAVLAAHPIAYWRLGETSGSVARDASGLHNNGTYQGSPALGRPGAIVDDPNTSVRFDGVDDDVTWAPTMTQAGSFSVVAWINATSTTGANEQTFVSTRTPTAEYSFDFKLSAGTLKADIGDGSTWLLQETGIPYPFHAGTWYQVAATVTGTQVTLFVDGRSIGTEPFPGGAGTPLLFDPSHAVYVGTNARYTNEWFSGRIDEVALFPVALTAGTIHRLYAVGRAD